MITAPAQAPDGAISQRGAPSPVTRFVGHEFPRRIEELASSGVGFGGAEFEKQRRFYGVKHAFQAAFTAIQSLAHFPANLSQRVRIRVAAERAKVGAVPLPENAKIIVSKFAVLREPVGIATDFQKFLIEILAFMGSQVLRIGHAGDDQAGFSLIRRKIGGSSSWRPG